MSNILCDEMVGGIRNITLKTGTSFEDFKKLERTLKKPYKITIITNNMKYKEDGFIMVSRQCVGGLYVKSA